MAERASAETKTRRARSGPDDTVYPRPFRPVVDSRAHEHVVDQIVFGIRAGAYRVGERLPSVAGLAEQFHVSKPTIGEAIRLLAENGIVEIKRGVTGGVTVVRDDIPMSLLGLVPQRRQTDMREFLEARRAVEMEIARLAGRRGTDEDFARMRESIEGLEQHAGDDRRRSLHFDHLFHYAMGRAARSDLLAYYQHQILKQLVSLWPAYFYELEDRVTVVELHRRTLAALVRRDQRRIDRVMDEHLAVLENAVRAEEEATPASSRRTRRATGSR